MFATLFLEILQILAKVCSFTFKIFGVSEKTFINIFFSNPGLCKARDRQEAVARSYD